MGKGTVRPLELGPPRGGPAPAAAGGVVIRIPEASSLLAASLAWRALKRAVDVVASAILLVLTSPLMAAIAVAIKLESPGPAFFRHRRLGRGGREFGLIKFRTMVTDAEERLEAFLRTDPELLEEWNSRYKLRRDPRVTRVGRILRKTSLDELPQLFNILAGQMSLVGPRAIVRGELERFGNLAPTILSVKPGLTGLWAVSGRSDVSYEDRAVLEYRYVATWSFLMDLRILARTLPAVVRGHGAY
ncbi:MAG TPA: sugar transferase [Actinomycetota bacterium]|nr:sugar transferase [Actinomycetota bacterium]